MPDFRPSRRPPPAFPSAGFGRFTGPALWTLHGWVAIFFFASGYAKLTEDMSLLSLLMGWPAMTDAVVVRAVGWAEIGLAVALMMAIAVGRRGRFATQATTVILLLNTTGMSLYYLSRADPGLTVTNLVLTGLGLAILVGHRRTPWGPRRPAFGRKDL